MSMLDHVLLVFPIVKYLILYPIQASQSPHTRPPTQAQARKYIHIHIHTHTGTRTHPHKQTDKPCSVRFRQQSGECPAFCAVARSVPAAEAVPCYTTSQMQYDCWA